MMRREWLVKPVKKPRRAEAPQGEGGYRDQEGHYRDAGVQIGQHASRFRPAHGAGGSTVGLGMGYAVHRPPDHDAEACYCFRTRGGWQHAA